MAFAEEKGMLYRQEVADGISQEQFHSQEELLVPNRVELLMNGAGALAHLANLSSDVRITFTSLVFCNQALRTYH